ncbi:MAG: cardiolipin synthase ClsB [Rhodocyclaceae bacterium]|nr:cardiolipin synthase ClsB [Rhodocyclaceae bacterium]
MSLDRSLDHCAGLALLPGNDIELLESGAEYFPALIAAIDRARREVHLETYIYAADATARAVTDALVRAVRRGVKVRVLVDGFGAREFPRRHGEEIVAAGGEIAVYRPEVARLALRRNRLRRLHRKLAVIDGEIAFVGGINIIDDLDTPGLGPRYDYAVKVRGPLVVAIHRHVQKLWRLVGWVSLRRRQPLPRTALKQPAALGTMAATFVVRDNLRHRRDIEEAYLAALAAAKKEVWIANAYFLPGLRFRHALIHAAQRGVAVNVLLQGRVEYALLHYATQGLYRHLLAGGVRIWEYQSGFLHAKVAVVDELWATVGSSNIDPFSLLLAREANVIVCNQHFARRLKSSLLRAIANDAVEITHSALAASPWWKRALRWAAYGLVRVLLGITRYGGEDYRE